MTSKQAVFRADSSTALGSGHIMRCLTLADALAGRGFAVSFVCRDLPGNIIAAVTGRGYEVHTLLPHPVADDADEYERLLGAPRKTDAAATAAVLEAVGPVDLLAVDHYALDERWEKILKPLSGRLLAIDDLGNRRHDCDFLLDQNLAAGETKDYRALVPASCTLLLGTDYTLLRPDFAALRGGLRRRDGTVRRLLVFFGGGDEGNETGKALTAIALACPDVTVDVVLGAGNPHGEAIEKLCAGLPGATVHRQTTAMAALMAGADLAIGGCGTATWERCALGLPAICTSLAPNQEPIAAAAAAAGALIYLGKAAEVGAGDIAAALGRLLADPAAVRDMAARAAELVDGHGTERVVRALGLAKHKITIVTDAKYWMNDRIPALAAAFEARGHTVGWVHRVKDIPAGDWVFLLGCGEIAPPAVLVRNRHNIVVHASALPKGRGWSPLNWQIAAGVNSIPVTMFEAAPELDSGDIYATETLEFAGCELLDEMKPALAEATIRLCLRFADDYPGIVARRTPQEGEPSFYRKRSPADSKLDVTKPLAEQFDLLRAVDNEAYPAWFEHNGCRYTVKIYRDRE